MDKELGIESFHPDFSLGDGRHLMKELAEFLKNERLSSNLTVAALSAMSGISASMLDSFESFDFERFGAAILLRNTVRAYCNALHIDPDPLLEKYSSQIEECSVQAAGIKKYGRLQKTLYKRRKMIALPVLVFFLASAAVFYGGEWISKRRSKLYAPPNANRMFSQENLPAELQHLPASRPRVAKQEGANTSGKTGPTQKPAPKGELAAGNINNQPEAAAKGATVAKSSLPAPQPPKTDEKTAGKTCETGTPTAKADIGAGDMNDPAKAFQNAIPTDNNGSLAQFPLGESTEAVAGEGSLQGAEAHTLNRFTVEADGKVWIKVKIDGQKARSELLHPGDHREWVAAKSLDVVVGNAGGVRMKWNDKELEAPRDAGRVLRFRLPDYAKPAQG